MSWLEHVLGLEGTCSWVVGSLGNLLRQKMERPEAWGLDATVSSSPRLHVVASLSDWCGEDSEDNVTALWWGCSIAASARVGLGSWNGDRGPSCVA